MEGGLISVFLMFCLQKPKHNTDFCIFKYDIKYIALKYGAARKYTVYCQGELAISLPIYLTNPNLAVLCFSVAWTHLVDDFLDLRFFSA